MKSFLVGCGIAGLAALVGVPAEAQTAPAPLTRAEVRAELLRARAAGELDFTLMPVLRESAVRRGAQAAAAATPQTVPPVEAAREARRDAPAAEAARLAASR